MNNSTIFYLTHICWSSLDLPRMILNFINGSLSASEKENISKYKFQFLRDKQMVSLGILKECISSYLNMPTEEINFIHNSYGKPFIDPALNKINLQFNLAHSDNIGVFAFTTGTEIGIDVEKIDESFNYTDVIETCFTDHELNWFSEIPIKSRIKIFYKLWTGKEAFIKAIGKGLYFPLKKIEFSLDSNNELIIKNIFDQDFHTEEWYVKSFDISYNYISTVVLKSISPKIILYEWKNHSNINTIKVPSFI